MSDFGLPVGSQIPKEDVTAVFQNLANYSADADYVPLRAGDLPADELRFLLEFVDANQATVFRSKIDQLFEKNPPQLERLFRSTDVDGGTLYALRFKFDVEGYSTDSLFDVAYALRQELELVSCEPDLPHLALRPTENTGELGADHPAVSPPADKLWPIKNIRANKAWKLASSKGKGVSIALPESRVLPHSELETGALSVELSADMIVGGGQDIIPLNDEGGGDAYATAMASVAVSRQSGEITGPASSAHIVAIRSVTSSTEYNAAATARAIEYAVEAGCQIVALGRCGVYSRAVELAIEYAIANDLVVVAAAGDTSGPIEYPARYTGIAAVGGSTFNDLPWGQTCFGGEIAFVAPAEQVWTAEASDNQSEVCARNGTALSSALAAGAAALWLSHHGVDKLCELARLRSQSVQDLFLTAVKHTARRPNKWDDTRFGAGIIDCEALVRLAPGEIPEKERTDALSHRGKNTVSALVEEIVAEPLTTSDFDFSAVSAEVSELAYRYSRGENEDGKPVTVKGQWVSTYLQRLIETSGERALLRLLQPIREEGSMI